MNGAAAEKPVVFTEVPPAGEGSKDSIGCGDRLAQRAYGAGVSGSRYRHPAAGAPGPASDMLTLPASVRVFVARGATDLRRSC